MKNVKRIYLDREKKKLIVMGEEYPLTRYNGELWWRWQITGSEELISKFSKVALDI